MELNTEYWGEGIKATWSNYFYFASKSDGVNIDGWNSMINNNHMQLNKEIDQSIMYGFSYRSKICEVALTQRSGSTTPIVDRMDAPFTKYSIQRGDSVSPTKGRINDLEKRIGYGMSSSSFTGISNQGIYVRYALAKLRFLCRVEIHEFVENGDNLVNNNSWIMTLHEFLNHELYTRYINHDNIYVTCLKWKGYFENDVGSANEVTESTQPIGFFTIPALPEAFNDYTGDSDIYVPASFIQKVDGYFTQGGVSQGKFDSESASVDRAVFYNTSSNWDFLVVYRSGLSFSETFAYVPPEKLMDAFHEFAYFGLYYTGTQSVAESTALNLDDLYLGKMSNITGATDGDYIAFSSEDDPETARGKAIEANEATATGTDPMQDPNPHYTGDIPPEDPNNYVDKVELSKPKLSTVDVFNRSYAITAASLRVLADDLWNADDDKFTEIVEGLKLMGENPMNGLIDCRLYPFDITQMVQTAGSQPIVIGRTTLTVSGVKLTNDINAVIDLGSCKFMAYNHNFLDYSPYTTGRLVLPYCGTIPIDCAEFVGHTITAKMIVDIITGACCCCVFLDNVLTITAQGVCGVSIPMTGTDSASYASGVVSGLANAVTGVINAGVGIATGNVLQAGAGVAEVLGGAAKATQTPVQYAQSGTATPSCNNWLPQMPYFVVDSPIPNVPDDYGHCIGYACEIYDTLSNFSGFTVITNPDLSGFNATETEKDMIRSLMQEGIYL